jgi:hypothetical protein
MKKRRLILIASLSLAIAMFLGVLAMLPERPGVTKANFDRIQDGMTPDEVKENFGGRERDSAYVDMDGFEISSTGQNWIVDDHSHVNIRFIQGRVVEKRWVVQDETLLMKIRRWLHLD